jgi:hypothetical protein
MEINLNSQLQLPITFVELVERTLPPALFQLQIKQLVPLVPVKLDSTKLEMIVLPQLLLLMDISGSQPPVPILHAIQPVLNAPELKKPNAQLAFLSLLTGLNPFLTKPIILPLLKELELSLTEHALEYAQTDLELTLLEPIALQEKVLILSLEQIPEPLLEFSPFSPS